MLMSFMRLHVVQPGRRHPQACAAERSHLREVFAVGCCVTALLLATTAFAHVISKSLSRLTVSGNAVAYRLEVDPIDLAVGAGLIQSAEVPLSPGDLQADVSRISQYVAPRVSLSADGLACAADPWQLDSGAFPATVKLSTTFRCPSAVSRLLLQYLLFFELDAHHASIGRLEGPGGAVEFIVTDAEPEFESAVPRGAVWWGGRAGQFFGYGVQHILIGYDHLLFLLGLVVTSLRLRHLASVVTVFTVAHTATLLLAVLGYVSLPARIVEPMIALSIAYVAVENLTGRPLRWRWAVVFAFGLIHGLGFASVLTELAGQGRASVGSLLAFNLGVEAGQLLAILAVFPLLLLLTRIGSQAGLKRYASLSILMVSLYWFTERVFLV